MINYSVYGRMNTILVYASVIFISMNTFMFMNFIHADYKDWVLTIILSSIIFSISAFYGFRSLNIIADEIPIQNKNEKLSEQCNNQAIFFASGLLILFITLIFIYFEV